MVSKPKDWLCEEKLAYAAGITSLAGIDEAGRGALAGPVVAACVLLPKNCVPEGINDSKQLSASQRESCFVSIQRSALGIGVGIIDASTIDSVNILRATHMAMREAYIRLNAHIAIDFVLIDGLPVMPFPVMQKAIVKGDEHVASIAAASIIAKVTRDRIMVEFDSIYRDYYFAQHKGYGTELHLRALAKNGPCPIHRESFKPVARYITVSESSTPQNLVLQFDDEPQSL